jgi:hypothetical protein
VFDSSRRIWVGKDNRGTKVWKWKVPSIDEEDNRQEDAENFRYARSATSMKDWFRSWVPSARLRLVGSVTRGLFVSVSHRVRVTVWQIQKASADPMKRTGSLTFPFPSPAQRFTATSPAFPFFLLSAIPTYDWRRVASFILPR